MQMNVVNEGMVCAYRVCVKGLLYVKKEIEVRRMFIWKCRFILPVFAFFYKMLYKFHGVVFKKKMMSYI